MTANIRIYFKPVRAMIHSAKASLLSSTTLGFMTGKSALTPYSPGNSLSAPG